MDDRAGSARVTYTEADMVAAQRIWWAGAVRWQALLRILAILWVLYLLLFTALAAWLEDAHPLRTGLEIATPTALAVVPVLVGIGWLMTPWRARRAFRQNKAMAGEYAFRWERDGITVDSLRGHVTLPWTVLHRWTDGPAALLLFQSDQLFTPIPRRVLAPGDAPTLIRHLRGAGVAERRRFGLLASREGRA